MEDLYQYPLKTIYWYCSEDTLRPISSLFLSYDKEKHLEQIISYRDTTATGRTEYRYDQNSLLRSKQHFSRLGSGPPTIYEYDAKARLILESCEDKKRGSIRKIVYSYDAKGRLLTKEGPNVRTENYLFEYSEDGKLLKTYKDHSLEVTYVYEKDRLVKEVHHEFDGTQSYSVTIAFEFDQNGRVLTKKQDKDIVEKNVYEQGRLVRRWENTFGQDPCHDSPCCGKHFYKYEYYR